MKKLKKFKVYVEPTYEEKIYIVKAADEFEAELAAIKLHDRNRWESCIVRDYEEEA